ncbi:MAG: mechanosensitive ion channel family protein, partial [Vulcanococcus sp.]
MHRLLHLLLTGLLTALLAAQLISGGTLQAQAEPAGRPEVGVPFDRQPFHAALLETAERWRDAPLGQVVGDSPRDTLLNFYAVMARVD